MAAEPNLGPEFPCDADLEPFVAGGTMNAWQAMATTTCRAAAKSLEILEALQKKMDEDPAPQPTEQTWTPQPKYKSL